MAAFLLKRLGTSVVLLLVVSLLTFVLISLSPGDAAHTILGAYATPATLAEVRSELHLDAPLPVQYLSWLGDALRGNLGNSLLTGQPVVAAIGARLEPTIAILVITFTATMVISILLGVIAALHGGVVARIVDALGLLGIAIPGFVVALILILVFAVRLRVFPVGGYSSLSDGLGPWALGLVLPVVALTFGSIGVVSKQVRASMLDALSSEFVRTLTANGFRRRSVVYRHALRSAAIPVLALAGLSVVGILGGEVLIENVFGIPGLGGLAVQSAGQKDIPIVQAVTIVFTLIIVIVNALIDIAYVFVNPKVSAR